MTKMLKGPCMIVRPSKAGAGKHIVWIKWPDGFEQQLDDFDSEAEAELWIRNDSEAWLKKHPKNKS